MRFMSPRQQLPPYKNAYNRPPFPQNITDSQFGRPPKIRKPRYTNIKDKFLIFVFNRNYLF